MTSWRSHTHKGIKCLRFNRKPKASTLQKESLLTDAESMPMNFQTVCLRGRIRGFDECNHCFPALWTAPDIGHSEARYASEQLAQSMTREFTPSVCEVCSNESTADRSLDVEVVN